MRIERWKEPASGPDDVVVERPRPMLGSKHGLAHIVGYNGDIRFDVLLTRQEIRILGAMQDPPLCPLEPEDMEWKTDP